MKDKDWIYQLLGYVLLYWHDEHRIDHLAVYFTRQSFLLKWEVSDLLKELTGVADTALEGIWQEWYDDGNVLIALAEKFASDVHPQMSLIHHGDIATAVILALTAVMDERIVNIIDDAPTTVYELAQIVGATYEPSAEPLANSWRLHIDGTLARSLGSKSKVSAVYRASEEGTL